MKAYVGTFIKTDGSKRTMRFCKISEMPRVFLESKINNKRKSYNFGEGNELVWDIDKMNFRVFNHKSLISPLEVIEFDENKLI